MLSGKIVVGLRSAQVPGEEGGAHCADGLWIGRDGEGQGEFTRQDSVQAANESQ